MVKFETYMVRGIHQRGALALKKDLFQEACLFRNPNYRGGIRTWFEMFGQPPLSIIQRDQQKISDIFKTSLVRQ